MSNKILKIKKCENRKSRIYLVESNNKLRKITTLKLCKLKARYIPNAQFYGNFVPAMGSQ